MSTVYNNDTPRHQNIILILTSINIDRIPVRSSLYDKIILILLDQTTKGVQTLLIELIFLLFTVNSFNDNAKNYIE